MGRGGDGHFRYNDPVGQKLDTVWHLAVDELTYNTPAQTRFHLPPWPPDYSGLSTAFRQQC